MRFLFDIGFITVLVAMFWWASVPTAAKQYGTMSIDPANLMTTTTNLPTQQYDAF